MTTNVLLWAMGFITVLSLAVALGTWVSRNRWMQTLNTATRETVAAKDSHITALEQHVAVVRQVDSVRMAERYIAAKKGLETRSARLAAELSRARARREEAERTINDLLLDGETRSSEIARLRSDLLKTQQDAQRLEQIVKAIYTVGPIAIEEVKKELAARRRLAAHVKGRLEHLGLEGEARFAENERLKGEVEQCRAEVERIAREMEVTRSAGAILDGMLGIDSEIRERLAPYVSERLEESVRRLSSVHGRDPFADIIGSTAREAGRDSMLLESGADSANGAAAAVPEASVGEATPAMEDPSNGRGAVADSSTEARPSAGGDSLAAERAEWLRSLSRPPSALGGPTGTRT
jgi:hypothetical protein